MTRSTLDLHDTTDTRNGQFAVKPVGPPTGPAATRSLTTLLTSARTWMANPFAMPAMAVVVVGTLAVTGIGNVPRAVSAFPFDIPAIFIGLALYTAMVDATGLGDAVAVRLARRSRGRQRATLTLSIAVLLMTSCAGNNLNHVGLILPILLILLTTLGASRTYLVAYFGCVMAVVNLAGASTPVGDFPALTIMSSGITSFGSYLSIAFPLFGLLTPLALLGVYQLILRLRSTTSTATGGLPPEAGAVLLAARMQDAKVDVGSLVRLLAVLVGMFAGWVALPSVSPWIVGWAGTIIAAAVTPRARHAAKLESVDLVPILKIGTFLGVASYVSTTGVLGKIAAMLQDIHQPVVLLLVMMATVSIVTAVVSAGPTAAVLLPVAQTLVAPAAVLAGRGDLVAIAFAGSICAGSSCFLISATAGPLIARRVAASRLADGNGNPVLFTWRDYLPYGLLNMTVQLVVAVAAVLALYEIGW